MNARTLAPGRSAWADRGFSSARALEGLSGTDGGRLTTICLAFFGAREQAGLTQEELSFRAGLSRPYISQFERNLKSPTVETLFLICEALGVSASEVIGRVEAARRRQGRSVP